MVPALGPASEPAIPPTVVRPAPPLAGSHRSRSPAVRRNDRWLVDPPTASTASCRATARPSPADRPRRRRFLRSRSPAVPPVRAQPAPPTRRPRGLRRTGDGPSWPPPPRRHGRRPRAPWPDAPHRHHTTARRSPKTPTVPVQSRTTTPTCAGRGCPAGHARSLGGPEQVRWQRWLRRARCAAVRALNVPDSGRRGRSLDVAYASGHG